MDGKEVCEARRWSFGVVSAWAIVVLRGEVCRRKWLWKMKKENMDVKEVCETRRGRSLGAVNE